MLRNLEFLFCCLFPCDSLKLFFIAGVLIGVDKETLLVLSDNCEDIETDL